LNSKESSGSGAVWCCNLIMRGTLVQMPWPRGRLIPASDSRTLDFPEDWSPTTTMVGSCMPSFMTWRCLSLSTASSRGRIRSLNDDTMGTCLTTSSWCFSSMICGSDSTSFSELFDISSLFEPQWLSTTPILLTGRNFE